MVVKPGVALEEGLGSGRVAIALEAIRTHHPAVASSMAAMRGARMLTLRALNDDP